VSEDSKSSLDYFKAFPVDDKLVEIVTEGGAGNTVDVVQRGIAMMVEAKKRKQPYIHVYCVFDKDDFDVERYGAAFSKAAAHNDLTAIWANECFELWYLLHFEFRNTGLGRAEIFRKLSEEGLLGKKYDKSDKSVYTLLESKHQVAIENSKKLLNAAKEEEIRSPWRVNPSTNVHEIVEAMNALCEVSPSTV